MWLSNGDRFVLNPKVEDLKKWLPILTRYEEFSFRDDLEVEYVQEFPSARMQGHECIFFVRDPRDAIHSQYRRAQSEMEFDAYARFLNPQTLLDRASHWRLYASSWLELTEGRFYRFEDYKQGALKVLKQVVHSLGLQVSAEKIERAVEESSFDKSRQAELRFRANHPNDKEVANRAGRVGEWQSRSDNKKTFSYIEDRTASMLVQFGYALTTDSARSARTECIGHLDCLSLFSDICLPDSLRSIDVDPAHKARAIAVITEFAATLDEATLVKSKLAPADVRTLLGSIEEALSAFVHEQNSRMHDLAARYADGSSHHLVRIRELLAQKRANGRQVQQ
jgi:hypothetical protein